MDLAELESAIGIGGNGENKRGVAVGLVIAGRIQIDGRIAYRITVGRNRALYRSR
jgi:hypothetical protein